MLMCQQALEPYISREIMTLHHDKHHQNYVNALNAATAGQVRALENSDIKQQIELQQIMSVDHSPPIFHLPTDISVVNSMEGVILTIPSSGRTSVPLGRPLRRQMRRRG